MHSVGVCEISMQKQRMHAQKLTRPVYDIGLHVFLRLGMESREFQVRIITRFGISIRRMIISILKIIGNSYSMEGGGIEQTLCLTNARFNKLYVQQTLFKKR